MTKKVRQMKPVPFVSKKEKEKIEKQKAHNYYFTVYFISVCFFI